ncbi:MAG: pullulanase, partial [Ignavibacteria bacterium]
MRILAAVLILFVLSTNNFKGIQLLETKKIKREVISKVKHGSDGIKEIDKFFSNKKLGSFVENNNTFFRLFAPSAVKVLLVIFDSLKDNEGISYEMLKDSDGVWEYVADGEKSGAYYGYK